jgi:hypothetical protein
MAQSGRCARPSHCSSASIGFDYGAVGQEEKQADDCEQHQYVPKGDRTERLEMPSG